MNNNIALDYLTSSVVYDKSYADGLNDSIKQLLYHKDKYVRVRALFLYSKLTDMSNNNGNYEYLHKSVKEFFVDSEP